MEFNQVIDSSQYEKHLHRLDIECEALLEQSEFDAILVSAGANSFYYDDDQSPPFHANPHFLRWIPQTQCENAVLLIAPRRQKRLYWHTSNDYWHQMSRAPDWLTNSINVLEFGSSEDLINKCVYDIKEFRHIAHVGPRSEALSSHPNIQINPSLIIQSLEDSRRIKSKFELENIVAASRMAVQGHAAAKNVFYDGGSEFDIHHAFLVASSQTEAEQPYPAIMALNEHAGILHYQFYERATPTDVHSFLIDAGAKYACYHSDITRTYAYDSTSEFSSLIAALDAQQRLLIQEIKIGLSYVELQKTMHHKIAKLLVDFDLVDCSPEAAVEERITDIFFPHGIGHLLGLQTHDVGGHRSNGNTAVLEAQACFPSLRYSGDIMEDQVFTIEPGLYFIPILLKKISGNKSINWRKVERFMPFGGIRIEDNVHIKKDGVRNLTRDAFLQVA